MNNFVFSQDPLLFGNTYPQTIHNESEMRHKMDDAYAKFKEMEEQYSKMNQPKLETKTGYDYLGELDSLLKSVDSNISEDLKNNSEFQKLSSNLQLLIQNEMMSNIKWKINSNENAINNMKRQKEIVEGMKKEKEKEQKENMMELNDYIKNYSDMTFNEYKSLKKKKDDDK